MLIPETHDMIRYFVSVCFTAFISMMFRLIWIPVWFSPNSKSHRNLSGGGSDISLQGDSCTGITVIYNYSYTRNDTDHFN